jgi:hypothetical protein
MRNTNIKIDVKFMYNEQTDDLYAFFPKWEEGKNECGDKLYTMYSHVGQHSSGCYEYVAESRPATKEEYNNLMLELESIGYDLNII